MRDLLLLALILSSIILIHESGHYLAARAFGIECRTFSLGMGPVLWSRQGKHVKWCLRLVPCGGSVEIAGESRVPADCIDPDGSPSWILSVPIKKRLYARPFRQRALVLSAGIMANLVTGFLFLFIACYMVRPDQAFSLALSSLGQMFASFAQVLTHPSPDSLSGPVGIWQSVQFANGQASVLLYLAGILSVSIALFNALPVPALDGGRVIMALVERIRRKHFSLKTSNILIAGSMLVLCFMMLAVTGRELWQLFDGPGMGT